MANDLTETIRNKVVQTFYQGDNQMEKNEDIELTTKTPPKAHENVRNIIDWSLALKRAGKTFHSKFNNHEIIILVSFYFCGIKIIRSYQTESAPVFL